MGISAFERLSIRTALGIGFGVTLAVWLVAGYYFARQMSTVESESAAISARYLRAQDVLSSVGSRVLLASVYLRDSLLDPDSADIATRRVRFDEIYDGLDRQLDAYVPVMSAGDEPEQIRRLRLEIAALRTSSRDVLETIPQSSREIRNLLNAHVIPRRESVISASEGVRALNRTAFVDQHRVIAELHRVADRRSWQWLGVGFAICLAVGVLATIYSARLERRLRAYGASEARNRERLQRLSNRLISAQEEERRSLARELHDEVGQVLTTIKVELAVVQRRLATSGTQGMLDEAITITDSAVQSVRDLSYLLRPAMLDDLGLVAAVDWYLGAFAKRHPVEIEFHHIGLDGRLGSEVELAAYRIVQEAVTNVARHARARHCRVELIGGPETLHLRIVDDGRGFDQRSSSTVERMGLGLLNMRERAERVHGSFTLETALGAGTRIEVLLPSRAVDEPTGRNLEPESVRG